MHHAYTITRHAHERCTARSIPPMIAELIVEFGEARDAGDGAWKYALSKTSMRAIRRYAGREIAKAITPYRNRNAYVVAATGRIITAAYASRPFVA